MNRITAVCMLIIVSVVAACSNAATDGQPSNVEEDTGSFVFLVKAIHHGEIFYKPGSIIAKPLPTGTNVGIIGEFSLRNEQGETIFLAGTTLSECIEEHGSLSYSVDDEPIMRETWSLNGKNARDVVGAFLCSSVFNGSARQGNAIIDKSTTF